MRVHPDECPILSRTDFRLSETHGGPPRASQADFAPDRRKARDQREWPFRERTRRIEPEGGSGRESGSTGPPAKRPDPGHKLDGRLPPARRILPAVAERLDARLPDAEATVPEARAPSVRLSRQFGLLRALASSAPCRSSR